MTEETKPQADEDRLAKVIAARRGPKPKAQREALAETKPQADGASDSPATADAAYEPQRPKANLARVIMKRNYHPINDFLIDGNKPSDEQRVKVFAGAVIDMDRAEAKSCYDAGIVAPYDPFG